jgi:site-specific recombinase XerD
MKRRRPRPKLEELDPELVVRYIEQRTPFRAKATVYSVMSRMRGMGDFLVREGVWASNPLHWLQGPKITPYNPLAEAHRRSDMTALWEAAAQRSGYQQHLSITPRVRSHYDSLVFVRRSCATVRGVADVSTGPLE